MNSMQMRQKGSDFAKTKEYDVHGWPGYLFLFNKSELSIMLKYSETGAPHQI